MSEREHNGVSDEVLGDYVQAAAELAGERYPGDEFGVDKAMCDLIVYSTLTNVVTTCGNDLNALRKFQTGVATLGARIIGEYGVPQIEGAA